MLGLTTTKFLLEGLHRITKKCATARHTTTVIQVHPHDDEARLIVFTHRRRRLRGGDAGLQVQVYMFNNVDHYKLFEIHKNLTTRNNRLLLERKKCGAGTGKFSYLLPYFFFLTIESQDILKPSHQTWFMRRRPPPSTSAMAIPSLRSG